MFLYNYFDDPTKLFSDFHLTKFLDIFTSVKPCKIQPQPCRMIFSIYLFIYQSNFIY